MKVSVITISDRAYGGIYPDLSGQLLAAMLRAEGAECLYTLIPDDEALLSQALEASLACSWVFTTGGTGIGPRDITPETTMRFCDKEIPGIAEYLRAESLKETPFAVLSRAYAGLKGKTIVVNLPGSKKGAEFCLKLLLPLLQHGAAMAEGAAHS